MQRQSIVPVLLVLSVNGVTAWAQDIEPRAYSNAPVGTRFLIGGFAKTQGGIAFDPALPVSDPKLETSSGILAYAQAISLWGKAGKVDAILPYTDLSGSAQFAGRQLEREISGLGDPRFRISLGLYGAPALSVREFGRYRQDLIVGASVQVSPPTGQYDPSRLVNIGSNRWMVKPELGLSKALGKWTFETAASTAFYTDNENFFGGKIRHQEPIHSLRGHVIHNFGSGVWGSLDATYFAGGQTRVNSQWNDDQLSNWRVGATFALPVGRQDSVKFYASSGVAARTGNNYDLFGVAWQHRWGTGQ